MDAYDHLGTEQEIRKYWAVNKTYANLKARGVGAKPFTFLDGPPYTSGKVHIGTALNKSLKDMILRIKRMQGFDVFDRAGYDMHGLPTEQPTMKKLGLHTKEDIERYGVDKFIEACREWCLTNMREMNREFERLGVWMDFENAYQPITRSYISGTWMLIKRAYEKGRLYEGLRTMAWDPVFQTACAKHELDYVTVKDVSIYVKFPLEDGAAHAKTFFVIWTTTPWTIPFNLAIMVNPDVEYVKAKVGAETWIVAADRTGPFIREIVKEEFIVQETMQGSALAGLRYTHPFADRMPYADLRKHHPKIHSIVLSKEYVDTSAGTGLVHCAPGCGPEDYEVGIENGLPAYNTIHSDGSFPEPFQGLKAREDDREFTKLIEEAGALVAKQTITHEYPHSERSKAPVVYKTTKQWFFKINDLKEQLIASNNATHWQPVAGYNAFNSWLQNLRDNSITKQRFWGTPVPIWKNDETGEILVVGSVAELEQLSGKTIEDAHKPWIDEVTIPSHKHKGTVLHRIPDVLDVWVDAGSASWNALDYPSDTELVKTRYPADFILEGKDQIRGWFNLLTVAGHLALDGPAFKAVYMHGYINDSQGRKMSKSVGNYITPEEVLPKYGVDTFRLAMIGGGTPGLDISYSQDAITTSYRNLLVLWNSVQYVVDLCTTNDLAPVRVTSKDIGDEEERYTLSRLERMTREVNTAIETYDLPSIPRLVEAYFLELSRTYIQLTREKSASDEKQLVVDVLFTALERCLVLLAPVCPFITEALWQSLQEHGGSRGSVHEQTWPLEQPLFIDDALESDFALLQQVITAGLACREQLKQGVRWPLSELVVTTAHPKPHYDELIKRQMNVKHVRWTSISGVKTVKPNYGNLGKSFGKDTQKVAKLIESMQPLPPVTVDGYALLPQHVVITEDAPDGYVASDFGAGVVYVSTNVTPDLLEEGYVRELTRRVQALRKDMGLVKRDPILLHISSVNALSHHNVDELYRKSNATTAPSHFENRREEHIRDRTYAISAQKTI